MTSSGISYTVKELQHQVRQYVLTPEKARKRIEKVLHLVQRLLNPDLTDAQRCRTVKSLRNELHGPFRRIEDLGALSAIASKSATPSDKQILTGNGEQADEFENPEKDHQRRS